MDAEAGFPDAHFPHASYFIVSSRLRPGLDGGYTVATLRRALDLERVGGVVPTLLTLDFQPDYDEVLQQLSELGLASDSTRLENLFASIRRSPERVRAAAHAGGSAGAIVDERVDLDASGRAWRIVATNPDGTVRHTDFLGTDGGRLIRLPFVAGREDWHRAEVRIEVFDAGGELGGYFDGFGELYRWWIGDMVASSSAAVEKVVICEARQVGELLAVGDRDYALIHTVHNAHTQPPYGWDSPMDTSWERWFAVIANFDGVIWPTAAQRSDAERRFGHHPGWAVVPHPAQPLATLPDAAARDPYRAIVIARLADQKRVDHAIAAWPAVLEREPRARLDIYGDGARRSALEELVSELGLSASVTLHGYDPGATRQLQKAAVLLLTSRYEGQSLAVAEALSAGCPVVAYDVNYGPREMVEPSRTGALVQPGDLSALAAAVVGILGDPARIAEYSLSGWQWARTHSAEVSMASTSALVRDVLDARRARDRPGGSRQESRKEP